MTPVTTRVDRSAGAAGRAHRPPTAGPGWTARGRGRAGPAANPDRACLDATADGPGWPCPGPGRPAAAPAAAAGSSKNRSPSSSGSGWSRRAPTRARGRRGRCREVGLVPVGGLVPPPGPGGEGRPGAQLVVARRGDRRRARPPGCGAPRRWAARSSGAATWWAGRPRAPAAADSSAGSSRNSQEPSSPSPTGLLPLVGPVSRSQSDWAGTEPRRWPGEATPPLTGRRRHCRRAPTPPPTRPTRGRRSAAGQG